MIPGLAFHHFGLATRDETSALTFLSNLGYTIEKKIFDPLQSVNLTLCQHPEHPDVELVSMGDESGPLDRILKNNHCLTYHQCFSCEDPEQAMMKLEQLEIRYLKVSPSKPAVLFDDRKVAFIYVKGYGLVELLGDH